MTGPTFAAECAGKPDALGTSRTLMVDPTEHVRLGIMQYPETLPLSDHEVVLTFDDGPLPPYTNRALDILASECVKATFFLVGQVAKAHPGNGASDPGRRTYHRNAQQLASVHLSSHDSGTG